MLVQTRLPRRTYLVARLEYGSQPRARPSPHQTEMTAVIACHQLEDRIALAVTLGSKHDPFIGPAHH
jgi:hypothetical protein